MNIGGQVSRTTVALLTMGLIILTWGSYFIILQPKIERYKSQNEELNIQINNLNAEINTLTTEVADMKQEICTYKSHIIKLETEKKTLTNQTISLENEIETIRKFINDVQELEKYMLLGIEHMSTAYINEAYADAQYNEFCSCYDLELYSLAQYYADLMDVYYVYAQNEFEEAEAFFNQAKKYVPDDKYTELIDNYIKICEYAIKINSEMHQVGEYYSAACSCYDKQQWISGNKELEKGNKHLETRDDLVLDYNKYLANMEALLMDW